MVLLFLPLTWFRRYSRRLSRRRVRYWHRCHRGGRFTPSSRFISRCWTPRHWKLCVLRRIGPMSRGRIRALTTRRRESRRPGRFQGLRGSIGLGPQVITDNEFNVLSRLSAAHGQAYCHCSPCYVLDTSSAIWSATYPVSRSCRSEELSEKRFIIRCPVCFDAPPERRRRIMPYPVSLAPASYLIYNVIISCGYLSPPSHRSCHGWVSRGPATRGYGTTDLF